MEKYFDINEQGLSIRCKVYYNKDIRAIKNVVIATYGFGGNKDNHAVSKFAERIVTKYKGYGVVCFDWPCHGKDALDIFTMEACMDYLELVIHYVKEEKKVEVVYNYSASMGAYITLRYLNERIQDEQDGQKEQGGQNPFRRIAFRCPAIKMYDAFWKNVTPEEEDKLKKGKEIAAGYERKVKLDQAFFDDLKEHDVSQYDYMEYADDILMIHGTKDEMVPITVTEEFSENNVIELIPVENADHPFSNPDYMDFAIQKIISFFAPEWQDTIWEGDF